MHKSDEMTVGTVGTDEEEPGFPTAVKEEGVPAKEEGCASGEEGWSYLTYSFTGEDVVVPPDLVEKLHTLNREVIFNSIHPYREVSIALVDGERVLMFAHSDTLKYTALLSVIITVSTRTNSPHLHDFFRWGQLYQGKIKELVDLAIARGWVTQDDQETLLYDEALGRVSSSYSLGNHATPIPMHPSEVSYHRNYEPKEFDTRPFWDELH